MKLPNKPKVLASTYNPVSNTKMISFLVDFPTVLLAELRTHRILTQGSLYEHSELIDFNLSANSARAIPHNKYLEKVLDNPFIPIWTKQQKGMSGDFITKTKEITDEWESSLSDVKSHYKELVNLGTHKQNANRILSPFAYTTCIISGTEWDNFFELRCPKYTTKEGKVYNSKKSFKVGENIDNENIDFEWFFDVNSINKSTAQPEFQIIAELLYDLYQETDWKESRYHIPFEDDIKVLYDKQIENLVLNNQPHLGYNAKEVFDKVAEYYMKISASMCAKLSYNTQDNEDTLEKHLERADMLIEYKHSEPFSHQAIAMDAREYDLFSQTRLVGKDRKVFIEYGKCYNLRGFISNRYIIENLR